MRKRRSQRGFTLLELLISLAIMSMIAVMIGSAFSGLSRVTGRSADYGDAVEFALARQELRALIHATLPSGFPANDTSIFAGTRTALEFQAIVDDGVFWPGAPVYCSVKQSDDGAVLLIKTGLRDSDREAITVQQVLNGAESQLQITYYGQRTAEEPPVWRQEWDARYGLPLLVKITVLQQGNEIPPIVAQPAQTHLQSEMSLSSLVPPATPSRP